MLFLDGNVDEAAMRLSSSVFYDGSNIPRRFTCDAENISPPLAWSGAPKETRSFVVLCDGPDAPAGTWHHWAVYDIPAMVTMLAENAAERGSSKELKQAANDFNRIGYGGPCPPRGHGIHHYHFRLLALSVEHLAINIGKPSCREIELEARKHSIAEATLIGVYQRS